MSERPLYDDDGGDTFPRGGLVAHVETYDGAPDECTIYPAGLGDDDLMTSWITAEEGSFLPLSAMR